MLMNKLVRRVDFAVTFLSGIVFANMLGAIADGQFNFAFLSFVAVLLALAFRRFVEWDESV